MRRACQVLLTSIIALIRVLRCSDAQLSKNLILGCKRIIKKSSPQAAFCDLIIPLKRLII